MRKFAPLAVVAVCLLLMCAPIVPAQQKPAGAPPMPTMQDFHDMYAAAQYRICAQQVARVLNMKTPAAQVFDRGELLALRADCLLNLGDRAGAIRAYTDAQKSGNPDVWCHARAMELLVKSGKYRPKPAPTATTSPSTDVDPGAGVTDDAAMKQAMSDLLDVQRQRAEPKLRAAERAQNLAPILDALPEMMDLYALERTATGDTADIAPRIRDIGTIARSQMARELGRIDVRVQQLEGTANSSDSGGGRQAGGNGGTWWSGAGRRGLFSNERDDLRQTVDYVAKIQATAERGQHLARDFNGRPETWDPLITQCTTIDARANGLLDTN
jgi:hypothetical protein